MTYDNAFYTIEFWISIALLVFFLFGPWQSFVESAVRHKLFKIRDDLFDYAAGGNISFSDEDYIRIRDAINDFIRFAHTMTWWHIFLGKKTLTMNTSTDVRSLLDPSQKLPLEVRDQLRRSVVLSVAAIVALVVLRSPLMLLICLLIAPVAKIAELINNKDYSGKMSGYVGKALHREMMYSK